MRSLLLVGVLYGLWGLFPSFTQTAAEYQKAYYASYQDALTFLQQNQSLIKRELQKCGTAPTFIIPAVFPELVRFSGFQNQLETTSLQLLYVRFGASYANFSVGRFQMKPSFIEALEAEVKQRNIKQFQFIGEFADADLSKVRQQRVERLADLTWQVRYLACFQYIVSQKFPLHTFGKEKKVRFLAAAYNRGFQNSQAEIERWMLIKAFPYGKAYRGGTQYAYTDIAWYFSQNHFSESTLAK